MFEPNPMPLGAATVLHNAAVASANGSTILVRNHSLLQVDVTGTFSSKVTVAGYLTGTSNWQALDVYDRKGNILREITAPGSYFVEVSSYVGVRARVDSYVSGSVSVTARLSYGDLPRFPSSALVTEAIGVSVLAGAKTYIFSHVDMRGFPFYIASVRASAAGDFSVLFEPENSFPGSSDAAGLGATGFETALILNLEGNRNGFSERFTPIGRGGRFRIHNQDAADRTFDLRLFGYRQ
ncbi:MAG: hypothetical protein EON59_03255 [Alphaproteobacteria bacterium]|nr:MAG: hypothetical protein EON59_03255 [Alphaproteobacteria bacterium]